MRTTTWLTLIFEEMMSKEDPGPLSLLSDELFMEEFPIDDVPEELAFVTAETNQCTYIGKRDENNQPLVLVENKNK